jgi:hypothetical protein
VERIEQWGARSIVWVDGNDVHGSVAAALSGHSDLLGVSPEHGYTTPSIEFLREYPGVSGLVLPFASQYKLAPVLALANLRYLQVGESRELLDLSSFPQLEEVRLEWHEGVRFAELQVLRVLYLRGYSPISGSLQELPALPRLRELELNQGNVRTLAGISRFASLRRLQLYHLKRLETIADVCGTELEYLHVESCKSIGNLEEAACLDRLSVLRMNSCGRIRSLRFLDTMPVLEECRLMGTYVEDGDMSPLLRLDRVAFSRHKDYSHTPAEVQAWIRDRQHRS